MRIVVLGAGGIGGTIGARLHQGGYDVALIARGAHGEAASPSLRRTSAGHSTSGCTPTLPR